MQNTVTYIYKFIYLYGSLLNISCKLCIKVCLGAYIYAEAKEKNAITHINIYRGAHEEKKRELQLLYLPVFMILLLLYFN